MSDDSKVAATIDLDDPEFNQEQSYDPNQDMDSRIPPPELDGEGNAIEYLLKLSVGENKEGNKAPYPAKTKKDTKYIAINVKAQIVQPGGQFDKAFVNLMPVNTLLFNNTTSMANLARLLGELMPPRLSPKQQAEFVMELLLPEPTIPARIQWTGYCKACEEDIPQLAGEKHWPEKKDEDGNVIGHENVTTCLNCRSDVTVNVKVLRLLSTS